MPLESTSHTNFPFPYWGGGVDFHSLGYLHRAVELSKTIDCTTFW